MTSRTGITCKEMVELVTDYLEGSLPPAGKARFEAHLSSCADCAIYLDQMRKTIHSVGKLTASQLTSQAKNRLLGIFQDWKAGSG